MEAYIIGRYTTSIARTRAVRTSTGTVWMETKQTEKSALGETVWLPSSDKEIAAVAMQLIRDADWKSYVAKADAHLVAICPPDAFVVQADYDEVRRLAFLMGPGYSVGWSLGRRQPGSVTRVLKAGSGVDAESAAIMRTFFADEKVGATWQATMPAAIRSGA